MTITAPLVPGQRVRTTQAALASRRFGAHCTGTVAAVPRRGQFVQVRIDGREVVSRWPASFWRPLADGEVVEPPAEIAEPVVVARPRPKIKRHTQTVDQVAELVTAVLRGTAGLRCVEIARALDSRVPFARTRVASVLRARPGLFEKSSDGAAAVWRLRQAEDGAC